MRLSDLLRMTLDHVGQPDVTLQAELDFVSKYLDIEQTRFADRLNVRFDVQPGDPRHARADAPPPAAGRERRSSTGWPGRPDPAISRSPPGATANKLWIEVRDDGVGLSESALSALQKGIGVSTTRARLLHQFGADFRFEFHRQSPGLAVVVALPWREERPRPGGGRTPAGRRRPGQGRVNGPDRHLHLTGTMTGY